MHDQAKQFLYEDSFDTNYEERVINLLEKAKYFNFQNYFIENLINILQSFNPTQDRKSTRLNSSHSQISYAVFCLKKKKKNHESATHAASPLAPPLELPVPCAEKHLTIPNLALAMNTSYRAHRDIVIHAAVHHVS